MTYFVYILKSLKNDRYYIGVSNNLERRLSDHNKGFSKATKPNRPYVLVYNEEYINRKEAYGRESALKKLKSRKALEKLMNNS